MYSLKAVVGMLAVPCLLLAGSVEGIKGIDIIVKKQPTGGAAGATVQTDAAGNFSLLVTEPGTYQIGIFCPSGTPWRLTPGRYSVRTGQSYSLKRQIKAAAATDAQTKGPRRQFQVPDVDPALVPREGLTVFTEDVVITRVPSTIYGSLRPGAPMLSTNALTFLVEERAGPAGARLPPAPPQSFVINAGGEPEFTYEIQTIYKIRDDLGGRPGWLTLSSMRGSSPPPDLPPQIEARVDPSGLAPGFYQAELRVCTYTRNGTVIYNSLVATMVVKAAGTGPGLTLSRSGLLFTSLTGTNPDPETTQLCNESASATPWTVTVPREQAQVMAVAPTEGTLVPGQCTDLRVTVTAQALAAGVVRPPPILINRPAPPGQPGPLTTALDTWIFVAAPNCVANTVYPVVLSGPAEIVPRVGNNFAVAAVDNCGGMAAQGVVSATAGDPATPIYATRVSAVVAADSRPGAAQKGVLKGGQSGFLVLSPDTGGDSTEVTFTGEMAARKVLTITKSKSNIKNHLSVPLTADIPSGGGANPGGVGVPAPGGAVSVRKGVYKGGSSGFAIPDAIEGEWLIVNGKKAPILYTTPYEIAAVLPGDLPPGRHTLLLETPDGLSTPIEFDVDAAQPALYTWDGSGNGPAIVYNATRGGMVSEANPARANDVLVAYADGLGAVDPAIPDGQVAPADPLSRAVNPVEVTIAGQAAEVLFAGPVPGYAGFGQINFKAPALTGPVAVEEENIVVKVADVVNAQSATAWFAKTRTRTAQVTVTTNPPGLAVFVDGIRSATPRTFDWPVDSVHAVSVFSPQNATAAARLVFANWDGTVYAQSYTVKADANYTVTANFIQQFALTTAVNVPASVPAAVRPSVGAIPASADGFYSVGTDVRLTPGIGSNVRFNNWTGDATGSASPLIVTMNGAKSVTAVYQLAPVTPGPGPAPGPAPGPGLGLGN